jgi:hypothetical protein
VVRGGRAVERAVRADCMARNADADSSHRPGQSPAAVADDVGGYLRLSGSLEVNSPPGL